MKLKLLFLFIIFSSLIVAQAPISNYFSDPASQFAIVSGTVDNAPSGANATWSFSGLTQAGTNTDTFAAPTGAEMASYPGTTQVYTITDGAMNANQVFYELAGSTLSLTGASNANFTLDYNTDNALIGTYPLAFGTPATNDAIAGTINAQGQSPSYTGTINTEVDAYGALSFDVAGLGSYSGSVTRIVTTQNINFFVSGIFPGSVTITSHYYYKDSDGALVFRTTDGNITVAIAGIDQDFSSAEGLITNTLSTDSVVLDSNAIKLYPIPVEDRLEIDYNTNTLSIESIEIIDGNGKIILTSNTNFNHINTTNLNSGFYIISMSTNKGIVRRKFIKK